MSRYGITISPRMMNVGSTTAACHGSKKTSISCRPRKYHGALEGFGVRVGFAGSSSGASTRSDHTISNRMMPIEIRNSLRTRCGQVWILSSPGPVAFLIGTSIRLPAGATALSVGFVSGVAMRRYLSSSASARSAPRRADQKMRMMTKTKKKGMVSTRARWTTKVSAIRARVARLPQSSAVPRPRTAMNARTAAASRSAKAVTACISGSERRPREAVAADAPEVHRHEQARDQRDEDAVEDVEAEERVGADLAPAEEEGARVVDVAQAGDELVAGALVAEDGGGTPHVRAHRHGPDRELVPGQQVAREGEEQRQHEQDHAHHPVELARGLVGAGQEDAEHVQPDRDHHAVRGPAVHVPHEHAERHVVLEVLHVGVGVLRRRPVVEHEVDAGHDGHQVHEEGDAAHAPREAQPRGVPAHLGGMEVEPHVPRHHEDAVPRRVVVAVAEDGLPDLRLGDLTLDLIPSGHGSHLQEGAGLGPVALLVEILDALVDQELAVLRLGDAQALERARRRALEVDAGLVEAAPVAGALELVLGGEPARGAAEVRALGEQRVEPRLGADDPDALVLLELLAHLADRVVARRARLEGRRRLEEDAREGGAHGGQERDEGEGAEDAPAEAAEDVAPRPEPAQRRPLAGALLALALLLEHPPSGERGRIFLLGLGLSHRSPVPPAGACPAGRRGKNQKRSGAALARLGRCGRAVKEGV